MRELAILCTQEDGKNSSVLAELLEEPGAGRGPEAIGGPSADHLGIGGLPVAHPHGVENFDEPCGRLIVRPRCGCTIP
jgi:hypothetical protein